MSDGLALWVVATLLVTAGIVAACAVAERRRVRRLADQLSTWLGSTGYRPLSGGGSQAWRRLGIVLNAIGAAFERRGAELALERPWRYRLVDALVDPALLFSTAGRLLAANDAARHLFGIPVDAVAVTVVQAVGSATLAAAVREVQRTDSHLSIDVEHGDHDLRAVVTRIGDESLLVIRDRTREHRVEELRRNFVVNASHELKSPVTGIQTLTEALRVTVDRDPDRIRSLLRRLDQEAERLARLVHELLDLRRLV